MNPLDKKINEHFSGLVVRKDLVKAVRGNAIVPSYVLEYLLGQYCATSDDASIKSGIETVKEVLRKHYVHRNEAGLIKSFIKEKGRHKVIDKISVSLNDTDGVYEASFSNLGIKKVLVDIDTIKKNQKLLVSGIWCIVDLEYELNEDKATSPWILNSLKAIQLSHFDLDFFLSSRAKFSTSEWIDLLIQSIGFDPEMLSYRNKMLQLVRLIGFCERNYNLIELGPKGTGKSHIYSEFSPHGILISGGEITVPKLFVNNSSGKIGLVGYWDVITFDEFAGKQKRVDKALVDILKNYMANKSFSRGIETLGAEATMSFVGNTKHSVPYMLRNSDLFEELPEKFKDSAFLDRLHFYIPGWEVDILRGELFSNGYGFVVDYLAEVLKSFRNYDFSNKYEKHFELFNDISTRDRDGINKTFSGLMKIIYPNGEATKEEIRELLVFSMEGRKRVKDQLMRIDSTYSKVRFGYKETDTSNEFLIKTLEEEQYPEFYYREFTSKEKNINSELEIKSNTVTDNNKLEIEESPKHILFKENQKGITYKSLFSKYILGAKKIYITDPYIRIFYQIRNLMEFVELVVKTKKEDEIVSIHLTTIEDEFNSEQQNEYFYFIQGNVSIAGIEFTWEFDKTNTIHARHIVTDNGWKILLDRGLDIFQPYEMNNHFVLSNRLQEYRSCKTFEVTYLRT